MALPDFNLAASDPANPNARLLSAEQQRAMLAEALMQQQQGSDTSPIRSPWQGAARLAQGLMGGLERGRLDSDAAKGNTAWQKAMGDILGSGGAAPASTPLGAAIMGGDGASPTSAPAPAPADGGDLTEAYIRAAAAKRGIDPEIAVKVAKSEGLNSYTGDQGSSFGPFQLHYGGVAAGGNRVAGMGDDFTKATGLDARDPKTVNAQIDFALDQAKKGGWGPWHGAANSGIAPMQGIGQGGNVQLAGPVPTPDTADSAGQQPATAPAPAPAAAAPQVNRQALMAIISNPYAPAAAQQVAASILQNSFKQETAAPVSVGRGGALVDPRTGRVIYQGQADTADEPSSVREYKFYQSQLGPGQKPMPYDVWSTAKARAGATNVTTNVGAESAAQAGAVKEAQVSGEGAAKRKDEMLTAADSAPEKIARVNYLRNVLANTQTGPLAGIEGRAGSIATSLGISPETLKSIGIDPNQATNNEIAQKLAGELVVGSIGKGGFPANNFSDADRKFIEKIFPNIASQPGTNQAISDVLIAREQYNIQKANEYGQYLDDQEKAGKSPSYEQFERKWRVRHAEDNIFAPVQEKFLRGDYGPGPGAAAPTPNPAAMKGNAMPGTASAPPVQGAKQAPDGHWYTPDPARPGKYLQVR